MKKRTSLLLLPVIAWWGNKHGYFTGFVFYRVPWCFIVSVALIGWKEIKMDKACIGGMIFGIAIAPL
jgi:hypothetical protein